ncbi:hypothetical protein FA95DRAFT_1579517 [Auriscalpium vulgare]|uniref:Uncharacterized protein n=1 Tax=Auriscalpium vulgare TaxID=40419 RepID=A0ACB8SBY2_9AGAM|nr:hypothetical protein FA95DRAFT_1579517 [Auriscalpium vulgare]
MAKGKSSNPADAFRKAQRKKELKKNKTERGKARNFALVKKDTVDLEEEIEKLSAESSLSAADQIRLKDLQSELEKINKKKEEYIAEHPEQRKLVYRARRNKDKEQDAPNLATAANSTRSLFDKNGIPLHPERSLYYDPVMNPFGVPPPGMPYLERPLRPDEMESQEEEEDSDDDIIMPAGPPPGPGGVDSLKQEEEEGSDDDIPMPEGPPPGSALHQQLPPHPPTFHPFPPGVPPPQGNIAAFPPPVPSFPPLPFNGPPPGMPTIPPPPPGFPTANFLPPPGFPASPGPGFPPFAPHTFPQNFVGLPPPPPAGFPTFPGAMPAPPPGFFPRHSQATPMQDPLSSVPHQTFQARRAAHAVPPPTSSSAPVAASPASAAAVAAATVSAAPELRDFKKESTAFVPAALKRKKAVAPASASAQGASKVTAAPELAAREGEETAAGPARPDLVSTLRGQFGGGAAALTAKGGKEKPKSDYDKFVEEMGDILAKPTA